MTAESSAAKAGDMPDEASVCAYLEAHPEFFLQHGALLATLRLPHASGSAVSLVERQLAVLRERNVSLRQQLRSLSRAAEQNEGLLVQTRQLVVALIDASSRAELAAVFERDLCALFGADHAALILFETAPADGGESRPRRVDPAIAREHLASLLRGGSDVCGALRSEEMRFLFPRARGAGSGALAQLDGPGVEGVLAVGSDDAARYRREDGTLFLSHLAAVVGRLLAQRS